MSFEIEYLGLLVGQKEQYEDVTVDLEGLDDNSRKKRIQMRE